MDINNNLIMSWFTVGSFNVPSGPGLCEFTPPIQLNTMFKTYVTSLVRMPIFVTYWKDNYVGTYMENQSYNGMWVAVLQIGC